MLAHIGLITWGYAAGGLAAVPGHVLGPHVDLPRHAARAGRHAVPGHGRRHQHPGGPRAGCATSRGTCCTSTPTSASGSRCRTSCGPGRSSSPPRPPPPTGGRCGPRPPPRCSSGGSALPVYRTLRHDLRVTSVVPESRRRRVGLPDRPRPATGCRVPPASSSSGGSSTGPGWTRAHPYSLSAAPDGRSLRITVKDLGDGSASCARCAPAPGRWSRARTGGSPSGPAPARGRASSAPASASRRCARSPRSCPTRPGDAVLLQRAHRAGRCSPRELDVLARERGLQVLLAARAPARARLLARRRRRPARRPAPCCRAGCPTSPTATSTSAARRSGPPPSAARSHAAGVPAARLHVESFGW